MALNLSQGKPLKYYSSDRIAQLIGNGLLTFIDEKTKYNDFFSKDEVVFYKNQNDLILLKVKTINLDNLVWEQASDGNMFPHLYSSLDLSNVVEKFEIILQDDGNHKLPDSY